MCPADELFAADGQRYGSEGFTGRRGEGRCKQGKIGSLFWMLRGSAPRLCLRWPKNSCRNWPRTVLYPIMRVAALAL